MSYMPDSKRYDTMKYKTCGKSGLKLPILSIGLWHNFGEVDSEDNAREMLCYAFDHGITHFDLANNYGPPAGAAESMFGRIIKKDFHAHRDEMVISTKAGYWMWPGPYGDGGSRKYLMSSLDQSLKRMDLDYVDIFYSHRLDSETPLEETMLALDSAVRQGKALYAGISNYPPSQTQQASDILKSLGTPCLIHQVKYSMLNRQPEDGLFKVLEAENIGCIAFSPLAQGMLTDRYLDGIPGDSRAAKPHGFLKVDTITEDLLKKIRSLNKIAEKNKITLAQMSLLWVLRQPCMTSVLVGVSNIGQLKGNLEIVKKTDLSEKVIHQISEILID
ncbi:aldo/keto reductase [candidate division KSB1 bacterium]|nr:aldo/keto reductase [candidate division KSB1 bacterium]